jgi:hypothetical protein
MTFAQELKDAAERYVPYDVLAHCCIFNNYFSSTSVVTKMTGVYK